MRTLILCVDRDDDLGVKAGVTSPVIGRKDNLRAAISLGLIDPEDSDTNSIFAALKIYDQYYDKNEDVEIASLCGNKSVGTKSDSIIAFQLETVLQSVKPDHVIVVTDGAEDEFILPIISSRVKIDSINRVIIRQQKNIEGTIYFIAKAFQDEKIRKNILIPLSLVLLIWGILSLLNVFFYAIGATLIALGLYIMIRALHLEEPAIQVIRDIRKSLQTGMYVYIVMVLVASGILLIGFYFGFLAVFADNAPGFPYNIIVFLDKSFVYFVAGALVYILGKTLDTYLRTGKVEGSNLPIFISIFSVWFIFMAVSHILLYRFTAIVENFNFPTVMVNLILGGFIGFISIEIYHYIKSHYPENSK